MSLKPSKPCSFQRLAVNIHVLVVDWFVWCDLLITVFSSVNTLAVLWTGSGRIIVHFLQLFMWSLCAKVLRMFQKAHQYIILSFLCRMSHLLKVPTAAFWPQQVREKITLELRYGTRVLSWHCCLYRAAIWYWWLILVVSYCIKLRSLYYYCIQL